MCFSCLWKYVGVELKRSETYDRSVNMVFGLDDSEKKFKKAMETAGADMSIVNKWLKVYQKTKKNSVVVANRYYNVKKKLNMLSDYLKEMEAYIIKNEQDKKNRFVELVKSCKKMQGDFDDEFLISKADTDFQTTLSSVVKLGEKYGTNAQDTIILQSEIENLIYLTNEGLEREKPDLFALSFFYLNKSNADLAEFTFPEKIKEIHRFFEENFEEKILQQIFICVKQAEAISDKYEGCFDKKTRAIVDELQPLLIGKDLNQEAEQTAKMILDNMNKL